MSAGQERRSHGQPQGGQRPLLAAVQHKTTSIQIKPDDWESRSKVHIIPSFYPVSTLKSPPWGAMAGNPWPNKEENCRNQEPLVTSFGWAVKALEPKVSPVHLAPVSYFTKNKIFEFYGNINLFLMDIFFEMCAFLLKVEL